MKNKHRKSADARDKDPWLWDVINRTDKRQKRKRDADDGSIGGFALLVADEARATLLNELEQRTGLNAADGIGVGPGGGHFTVWFVADSGDGPRSYPMVETVKGLVVGVRESTPVVFSSLAIARFVEANHGDLAGMMTEVRDSTGMRVK